MSAPASGRAEATRAGLIYAALLTLCMAPALAGGRVFCFRDLADYTIPHKLYAVGELREGRLPLWNPWNFHGFPHLANLQSGVLYPPNLVLFLPFPVGLNLSIIGHFLLAAMGARALARRLGAGSGGALLGGIAYGLSPYLLSLTDLNGFLFTASWLPWLSHAGLRLAAERSPKRVLLTAMVFALAFLAGEPQTLALGIAIAVVGSLLRLERGRQALGLFASWSAAGALSLALVSPVLLPFLELVANSERSGAGMTREEVFQYSLEPSGLATLALPSLAGDVVRGTHWLDSQTYVRNPYLGVVILSLASLGCLRRDRIVYGLLGLALLGVLLALGPDGGLYPLLYDLGFRQSRFPVKFLVATVLALSQLAALGFERLTSKPRAAAALFAGWALIGLVLAQRGTPGPVADAGMHVALSAGAALGALALLRRYRFAPWLLIASAALELLWAAQPTLTTTSARDLLAPTPAVARLQSALGPDRTPWPRVYVPPISEAALRWVYAEGESQAVDRKKELLFGNMNLLFGIGVNRGGESVQVRWTAELLDVVDRGPVARPLLNLLGARYFLRLGQEAEPGFAPLRQAEVSVFENPSALPHAFLVGRVNVGRTLERLTDAGFEPRQEATLERGVGALDTRCAGVEGRVTRRRPDEIVVELPGAAGRCLLVVTDSYYPGWSVRVDGRPAEPLRTDHAFLGVVVEPGARLVRFEYEARSFRSGLRIAALGLLVSAGLALATVLPTLRRAP